jgi:hypothetical protein
MTGSFWWPCYEPCQVSWVEVLPKTSHGHILWLMSAVLITHRPLKSFPVKRPYWSVVSNSGLSTVLERLVWQTTTNQCLKLITFIVNCARKCIECNENSSWKSSKQIKPDCLVAKFGQSFAECPNPVGNCAVVFSEGFASTKFIHFVRFLLWNLTLFSNLRYGTVSSIAPNRRNFILPPASLL